MGGGEAGFGNGPRGSRRRAAAGLEFAGRDYRGGGASSSTGSGPRTEAIGGGASGELRRAPFGFRARIGNLRGFGGHTSGRGIQPDASANLKYYGGSQNFVR